ncbi:hypothetical protein BKA70DRAFT_1234459 [Coprinopsis sp. MPI-PUGE-AT-0042]|nr:hypothetical protein BKA70DRAFT_1234459 [Coprinopsis sp. MPI-PUGE-AT-0042]
MDDAYEWGGRREPASEPSIDTGEIVISALHNLVFMWRSLLFSTVHIALAGNPSSSSSSQPSSSHRNSVLRFFLAFLPLPNTSGFASLDGELRDRLLKGLSKQTMVANVWDAEHPLANSGPVIEPWWMLGVVESGMTAFEDRSDSGSTLRRPYPMEEIELLFATLPVHTDVEATRIDLLRWIQKLEGWALQEISDHSTLRLQNPDFVCAAAEHENGEARNLDEEGGGPRRGYLRPMQSQHSLLATEVMSGACVIIIASNTLPRPTQITEPPGLSSNAAIPLPSEAPGRYGFKQTRLTVLSRKHLLLAQAQFGRPERISNRFRTTAVQDPDLGEVKRNGKKRRRRGAVTIASYPTPEDAESTRKYLQRRARSESAKGRYKRYACRACCSTFTKKRRKEREKRDVAEQLLDVAYSPVTRASWASPSSREEILWRFLDGFLTRKDATDVYEMAEVGGRGVPRGHHVAGNDEGKSGQITIIRENKLADH